MGIDVHVPAFDPAQFRKTVPKCCDVFLKNRVVGNTAGSPKMRTIKTGRF